MVDENRKTPDRNYQELHSETVMVAIVGGPELHVDQVDCGVRTTDVDYLVNKTEQLITEGNEEKYGACIRGGWSELRCDWCLTFMLVL